MPVLLFAGDSIMESLGPVMAEMLPPHAKGTIVQAGQPGSGLLRPEVYDWPAAMRTYMTTVHPKLVVMCIGTNDDRPLSHEGVTHEFNTPGWEQAYAKKVQEIIAIIAENKGTSLWVSPPIMGSPDLRARVYTIKEIIRRTCESQGVPFVDVWQTLADHAGNYQRFGVDAERRPMSLRTEDGIHVAPGGNMRLARTIIPRIKEQLGVKDPQ